MNKSSCIYCLKEHLPVLTHIYLHLKVSTPRTITNSHFPDDWSFLTCPVPTRIFLTSPVICPLITRPVVTLHAFRFLVSNLATFHGTHDCLQFGAKNPWKRNNPCVPWMYQVLATHPRNKQRSEWVKKHFLKLLSYWRLQKDFMSIHKLGTDV